MFDPKLKEALGRVQKPGRYTGGEPGSIYKEKDKVDVRFASQAGEIEVCHQGRGLDFDEDLAKKLLTEHQRIIFNGNGYSEEWVEEAERRGLPNIQSMVDAIPALVTEETIQMCVKFGVFTEAEL